MNRQTRQIVLDFALLVGLTALLIWPLFKVKYLDNWTSIDATFIADARWLSENGPMPGWQPLWYNGTRFDYIYPPGLRYGPAAFIKLFGLAPARAYHLYTAIWFALGIGGVFLLVRLGAKSRFMAWYVATATALVSPMYLFNVPMRQDSLVDHAMPQRFNALVRYGEGPHMSSLAILGFALAAAWFGLRPGRWRAFALAAFGAAFVVTHNFYGATALAIFFPLLCWSIFAETRDWKIWLRAAGIAVLAYALTAFWLTPSYLQVTTRNLALVAQPGHVWSKVLAGVTALLFGAMTWWRRWPAWQSFVIGAAIFFTMNVVGHYFFDFRVTGEPERLTPEADLCLLMAFGLLLSTMWQRQWRVWALTLAVLSLVPAYPHIAKSWKRIHSTTWWESRIERKMAQWVDQNRPGQRSLATGTVRFWWNGWFNQPQFGGGSEQGLTNFNAVGPMWRLMMGDQGAAEVPLLQSFGIDLVIMNDNRSKLAIVDYVKPDKYIGVLPVAYDDGAGNWIHQVPRRWPNQARVIAEADAGKLIAPLSGDHAEAFQLYADMLEKGPPQEVRTQWLAPNHLRMQTQVNAGQDIAVLQSYDTGWHAYANGKPLPVLADPLGQIRLAVPDGTNGTIDLVWQFPFENILGRWIAGFGLLLTAWLFWRGDGA